MNTVKLFRLATGCCSLLALAPAVHAQESPQQPAQNSGAGAPDPEIGADIIVTAQKREQRILDVPASVAVVDDRQLARQQVNNLADLSRTTPSLEINQAPGQNLGGGGQIRGLGTQTFGIGASAAVGVVVDGVSQGSVNISQLFDVQRVEVLKGPQGTLFGLTTSAGVINITTKAPSFKEFSGQVRAQLSDEGFAGSTGYGQQVISGGMNVPISSIAGLRLSGIIDLRQGPGRNALDGSLDAHNGYSARARLLIAPTDALQIDLNADFNKSTGGYADFFTVRSATPSFAVALANCRPSPGATTTPVVASPGNRDYCSTIEGRSGGENFGGSATVAYDFGSATLTSITAARRQRATPNTVDDVFRLTNAYFAPPPAVAPTLVQGIGTPDPNPTDLFTQEFRVASRTGSRLEYTVGVFYSSLKSTTVGGAQLVIGDVFALGAPPLILVRNLSTPGGTRDTQHAVFGQATYHVNDQLGLIAGGRYTRENLSQYSFNTTGVRSESGSKIDNTSWRFGLQYEIDRALTTYATVARGYKGAQFATPPVGSPPGTPNTLINPEIPTAYEIGLKTALFDRRAVLDVSAFYTTVDGYQGQTCSTQATGLLSCTTTNIDGIKSKGVEANLFGQVTKNLTINTGLIYNPATYPNRTAVGGPYLASDQTNISGAQLVNSPRWKFTSSAEYSQPLSSALLGFLSADAVYRSRTPYAASSDPNLSYHANWIVGGRLGIRDANDRWSAAVFVRNLTNEHQPFLLQAAFPNAGNYGQMLGAQSFRSVGLNLEGKF
ncbi:TonB-dependent receptor [Sphingomonas faeni]|uniref:TonB-dependent receptor n=1 Tax=Sphingomonas faeni TaxID=185950 RepID=UPI0024133240|nr:TonB-dependent receptor [Sphingomonas faeni]